MNYCRQTIAEQANVFLTKPGDDVAASTPFQGFRRGGGGGLGGGDRLPTRVFHLGAQDGTKTHLLA